MTAKQYMRCLRCDPPNSKKKRQFRRPCEATHCPYCHYRKLLRVHRQLWHGMAAPEREKRQSVPARKRPRTKTVLGLHTHTVPHDALADYVAEVRKANIGRQLVRAGKLREGVITTNIHRTADGYRVTIAALGMTDEPVQHTQPQLPRKSWRETDGRCVEWRAAVRGHDAPIISPRQLWLLVGRAMPVVNDDSGIRIKRVSPFGPARQYIRSRGVFPKMISWSHRRSKFPPHVIADYVADRRERLNRAAAREIIRAIGKPLGVLDGKLHALIGDFIRRSNADYNDLGNWKSTSVDDLAGALELPIRFAPEVEYRLTINGYLGPPSRGGTGWSSAVWHLFGPRYLEADNSGFAPLDETLPPDQTAVLIREPGRQRKIIAIHTQADAVAFGGAEQIRGIRGPSGPIRAYVQPFKNFLAYVLDRWDRPCQSAKDFYCRIPSPPERSRPRKAATPA